MGRRRHQLARFGVVVEREADDRDGRHRLVGADETSAVSIVIDPPGAVWSGGAHYG